MQCVTSVSYSFKVNGRITGKVIPSRELRHGDSLSPYLFVLCAQGLSAIFNQKSSQGLIQGIRIARGSPSITHLFFTDDSLILFKANKPNCKMIKDDLKEYKKASGQMINYDKSTITFSKNTPRHHINYNIEELNHTISQGHDFYLGLPTFSIRSKRIQFGYIRDIIAQKIDGWKNRFFSEGGKKILIKAVIQSIPTYAMSCFHIPITILKEVERLTTSFWWGDSKKWRKVHWKAWGHLQEPKNKGDLGFRDPHLVLSLYYQ